MNLFKLKPGWILQTLINRLPRSLRGWANGAAWLGSWYCFISSPLSILADFRWVLDCATFLIQRSGILREPLIFAGSVLHAIVETWRSITRPVSEILFGWLPIDVPQWASDLSVLAAILVFGLARSAWIKWSAQTKALRESPVTIRSAESELAVAANTKAAVFKAAEELQELEAYIAKMNAAEEGGRLMIDLPSRLSDMNDVVRSYQRIDMDDPRITSMPALRSLSRLSDDANGAANFHFRDFVGEERRQRAKEESDAQIANLGDVLLQRAHSERDGLRSRIRELDATGKRPLTVASDNSVDFIGALVSSRRVQHRALVIFVFLAAAFAVDLLYVGFVLKE